METNTDGSQYPVLIYGVNGPSSTGDLIKMGFVVSGVIDSRVYPGDSQLICKMKADNLDTEVDMEVKSSGDGYESVLCTSTSLYYGKFGGLMSISVVLKQTGIKLMGFEINIP